MQYTGWVPFEWRVRYNEVDSMGVVYHAHYLSWFEIGRTEWIRTQGFTYRALEEQGILLPLIAAELTFKAPAHYDDQITIYTKLMEYSPLKLHFAFEIRRNEELLVSGDTRHVWVNKLLKPIRIDKIVPDVFQMLSQAANG